MARGPVRWGLPARRRTGSRRELVTNRLSAYGAAARELGLGAEHIRGKRKNNRPGGSHVPIRLCERKMLGFRSPGSAQPFLATQAAVASDFITCRHLISAATHRQVRAEAFAAWREAAELAA
jgi:putative transposase